MQKPNDVRKFVIGAEQAEARGDHAEAERLLRRALVLQEFSLGAEHIEVAKTLNNLAIVSEMTGRLGDAEACYRRAYAIAASQLAPTDPFFVTSRENLEQFCQARNLPFNSPPVAPRSSPNAPMRPPAPPPRAAAPPTSASPKTAAPPSGATPPSSGAPAQTIVPPRVTAPPKPGTAPRPATPANAPHPASSADMPFLSEATISTTSLPTRVAPPKKPVTPPRPATPARAAQSVPLEDMTFRSEVPAARPSAPVRDDPTLPMPHSAFPGREAKRCPWRAFMVALAALVVVGAGWYWFASDPSERAASSAVSTSGNTPAPAADPAAPESKPSQPAPRTAAKPDAAAPRTAEPTVPLRPPVATAPGVATAPAPPPATTRPSSSVTVVTAQACRSLTRSDAWTCTPATGPQ